MEIGDIFGIDKFEKYREYAWQNDLVVYRLNDIVETIVNSDGIEENIVTKQFQLQQQPGQTEEEKKDILRWRRASLLAAFDIWEKAVLRGREEDSEEVMIWYRNILDLNEEAINNIPFVVEYYIDNVKK